MAEGFGILSLILFVIGLAYAVILFIFPLYVMHALKETLLGLQEILIELRAQRKERDG